MGGLGHSSLARLIELGITMVRIVDGDTVSESNLDRQFLFDHEDIGESKVKVVARKARELGIEVDEKFAFLNRENLFELTHDMDLIVDGSDNAGTRELINRAYVTLGKPVIFGAASLQAGHVLVCFDQMACYRCTFKESGTNQTCESVGVSVDLVKRIGSLQAEFAWRILTRDFSNTEPNLYTIDENQGKFRKLKIERYIHCPICG